MPDEPGYIPPVPVRFGPVRPPSQFPDNNSTPSVTWNCAGAGVLAGKREHPDCDGVSETGKKPGVFSGQLLREVFLNPGLCLLFGGIVIGFISGLQGHKVTHDPDSFFIVAFQGALCLFCSRWA